MKIKSLMIAAACALVLPAFAADADKATGEQPKAGVQPKAAAKAPAKEDAKKSAAEREKVAGEVKTPIEAKGVVEDLTPAKPYSLSNSRWVRDEDHER